jgi:ketosteroid isomerase-like protein
MGRPMPPLPSFAIFSILVCLAAGCGGRSITHGPTASPAAAAAGDPVLRAAVLEQDRRMADAYNAHDVDRLMAIFSADLEFFHDTGGALGFDQVKAGFTNVFANNPDIRRDLVGAVEVFPIKGYGAIQIGTHRFCHTERGKADCGTFRFTQVWRENAGSWQIARVVSFGH